jgi:hypothetical protein
MTRRQTPPLVRRNPQGMGAVAFAFAPQSSTPPRSVSIAYAPNRNERQHLMSNLSGLPA